MKLKIALLQLTPENSLEKQLDKGIAACKQAKKQGADIALFPEMWSDGYYLPQDKQKLEQLAINAESDFIKKFASLARELNLAIAISFLENKNSKFQDSVILFDRYGKEVFHYAKVHLCDFGDERVLTAGRTFQVANLNTVKGNIKVGSMICFDREFPESGRILMLKGAELVLVPNACPMEINRLSELRGCAFENMFAIATANYPSAKADCNGHSTLFDGVAYWPGYSPSRDMKVIETGENNGVYIAELNVDRLREYREHEIHGNAYRHPEKYALLVDQEINPPFIRKDRRN